MLFKVGNSFARSNAFSLVIAKNPDSFYKFNMLYIYYLPPDVSIVTLIAHKQSHMI